MSLNEIYAALLNGKKVFWMNDSYKVILDDHKLYTIHIYNDYMCGLQPSELIDCYVGN